MSDISVIIPAYQHADILGACLESVLNQTLKPKEIMVVDDGSTDNTQEVLDMFVRRRSTGRPVGTTPILKIHKKENQGNPNPTRNKGFELSSGSYVIFLDADVVMKPDMLEKLYGALESNPEAGFAYSSFKFGWKKFNSFPYDADRLKKMNYIHTSALIRRDAFPGFDENIKRFQDWDLWLTMLENGYEGVFVPEELFTAVQAHGRGKISISSWRPSFFYKIPWFGRKPESVKKYEEARKIILKKHGLWT